MKDNIREQLNNIKPDPSNKDGVYTQGHLHINQQTCPSCGYCPCCGRPRGNFNYPTYPNWPYYLGPYYQGPTCHNGL